MTIKDQAIRVAEWLGVPHAMGAGPRRGITTVLFHRFRFGDETWAAARDRLGAQLGLLTDVFEPISLAEAVEIVRGARAPVAQALVVTIDDAKRENLEVADLFTDAGVPVTHFVCAGWCARASRERDPEGARFRLAARLHFGAVAGIDSLTLGGRRFPLGSGENAEVIDRIIEARDPDDLERIDELDARLHKATAAPDDVCDWVELSDLRAAGAALECHSASHPRIAMQSTVRQRFEIIGARDYLTSRLGPVTHFAYPYGTPGSHDARTRDLVAQAGFDSAWTTRPDTISRDDEALTLPRLALPDRSMSLPVFRARVSGGNIPFERFKAVFR